jgi:uncharacterized protein (TIGR03790 family)
MPQSPHLLPFRTGRRIISFAAAAALLVLAVMHGAAFAADRQPQALAARTLVVYNADNPDSVSVANYYGSRRSIPSQNLCAIHPPATDTVTWSQYLSSVKAPVQNCLNAVGRSNILYIVFTYQTPYDVTSANVLTYYAVDQYVADIWDQYSTQDFYPYPEIWQTHPYYVESQNQGNYYQPFVSFANYRAQQNAMLIYSVWRLDAATADLAKGLVDKAMAAEGSGPTGQACLDRNEGDISHVYDFDYGEVEWDMHKAAMFSAQAGFPVTEDSNYEEFGTPPAANCPNAALYSGWYSLNHYNDAFTWNTGAIGWHMDSASAFDPRGGANWSANAIQKGITVTTGSVNEPLSSGLVREGGAFRDLFQGANVGDAFLRNTRWLKWVILYLGDPLYTPFPNGLPNFNPPAPQASLAFAPRYILNGSTSTGTVTLAQAAPPGGTVVSLSSNRSDIVQVPASVTIPPGQRSATFTATSPSAPLVTGDSGAEVTASDVGQSTLTVWPLLGAAVASPVNLIGGAFSTGTVQLNAPAPKGGAVVSLSGDNFLKLPATVTVPEGALVANFRIGSFTVPNQHSSPIKATLNEALITFGVILAPALQRLDVQPSSGPGGSSAQVIPVLGAPAPAVGWPVNFRSNNDSAASLPPQVTVPAYGWSKVVPLVTTPQCSNVPVRLLAYSGTAIAYGTYTVTPPPPSSLNFSGSVQGGNPVNATVYLTYPACSTGLPVGLSSSNPQVASVPASVTVPGGQTQASFVITTYHVDQPTQVTITATSDNTPVQRVLTVTP